MKKIFTLLVVIIVSCHPPINKENKVGLKVGNDTIEVVKDSEGRAYLKQYFYTEKGKQYLYIPFSLETGRHYIFIPINNNYDSNCNIPK